MPVPPSSDRRRLVAAHHLLYWAVRVNLPVLILQTILRDEGPALSVFQLNKIVLQVVTLQEPVVQRVWTPATRKVMLGGDCPSDIERMWPESRQVSV